MQAYAFLGLILTVIIVGAGAFYILNNITFKQTTNRYVYKQTVDRNGNIVTQVIDLEDNDQTVNQVAGENEKN